jgi:septal ring factor EnvC (AmiA/AmiB activator)
MQQAGEVDSNSGERTSVFLESKKRKQVEEDAVRLRNRLLQLERQAQKTDKRIGLTKQRARDILSQRERNEQRERERQQFLAELQLELQQHRRDMERCVPALHSSIVYKT